MPCCVAVGCSVREADKTVSPPITFHYFPTDKEMRNKWVQVVRRENWEPSKRSRLCSKHFREEDFDRSPFYTKLKKGVIPSRFDGFPKHLQKNNIKNHRPIKRSAPPLKNIRSPAKKTLESTLQNQHNVDNELNASTSQLLEAKYGEKEIQTKEIKEGDQTQNFYTPSIPNEQSFATPKPPKRTKTEENNDVEGINLMSSAFQLMQTAAAMIEPPPVDDEVTAFFNYATAKVKTFSPEKRRSIQNAVFDILMEADRGINESAHQNEDSTQSSSIPPEQSSPSQQPYDSASSEDDRSSV